MSFSLTEPQFLDGSKTVTRRVGWRNLMPGQRLKAVRKGMGLKKGEKVHVLGELEVVSVRVERLDSITQADVVAEGFPQMNPGEFVRFFAESHGKLKPWTDITRIEFRRVTA